MQYEVSGRGRQKTAGLCECDRGRRKRGDVRATPVVHREREHGSKDSDVQEECVFVMRLDTQPCQKVTKSVRFDEEDATRKMSVFRRLA